MDDNKTEQPPEKKTTKNKSRIILIISIVLSVLLVAAVSAFIGYSLNDQNDEVTNTPSQEKIEVITPDSEPETVSGKTFHTIVAEQFIFDENKDIKSELAIPDYLQAILVRSNISDIGYVGPLDINFVDEVGRWKIGNPNLSRDNAGDISLINITDEWLNKTSPSPDVPTVIAGRQYDFNTPENKQSIFDSLEQITRACVDNGEGVVISDSIYTCLQPILVAPPFGTYEPILDIAGVGSIGNNTFLISGYVRLIDREYTSEEAESRTKAFQEDNIPPETTTLVEDFREAFKNTTVTTEIRQ